MLGLGKFLAEGLEREVYLHPLSVDRVIKIGKPGVPVDRNIVEFEFYRRYCGEGLPFIPRIFGWVETERGYGLEVELISDMQGRPCPCLPDAVLAGLLPEHEALRLLNDFFDQLVCSAFLIADGNPTNFLYRPQDHALVMFDGFGPSDWTLKYRLRLRSRALVRHKVRKCQRLAVRQWKDWRQNKLAPETARLPAIEAAGEGLLRVDSP